MTDDVSLEDLKRMLADRAPDVAAHYCPDGVLVKGNWLSRCPWRADQSIGSFLIGVDGPKRGIAVDFAESAQGFNLLELIRRCIGAPGIGAAAREARVFLGLADMSADDRRAAQDRAAAAEARRAEEAARRAGDLERHRRSAKGLWLAGKPLAIDCPAGLYLAGRGLDLSLLAETRLPGALRFHPETWCADRQGKFPAMLAAIVDAEGRFLAVHRTYLAPRADGLWTKADIAKPKKVWPDFAGGFVPVWRGGFDGALGGYDTAKHGPLWITEGIENGLALAIAAPERRIVAAVAVTNLANIAWPPLSDKGGVGDLVLALDPDAPDSPAAAAAARAIARWQAEGRTVRAWRAAVDANDFLRGTAE